MMIDGVLLLLLATLAAAACLLLRAVRRGRDKRRLLRQAHGIGCSLSEEFGISALCSGIERPERIDALLASEYTRFEVIVVLDAGSDPDAFTRLVTRYRMIRVEWNGSQEFPQTGIRSLWRSRRRSCRRLVLVDRPQGLPLFASPMRRYYPGRRRSPALPDREQRFADWNAAASVAAYDYLLPLAGGVALLPDAVTRLVAELGEHPAGALQRVQSPLGVPVELLARDWLLDCGGFGAHRPQRLSRRQRITLWEPLACCADRQQARHRDRQLARLLRIALAAACAVTAAAAATGHWSGAATAATLALAAAALLCARHAVQHLSEQTCTALREHP